MEIDCEIRIKRPGVRHRSRIPVPKTLTELMFGEEDEREIENAARIAKALKEENCDD